MGEQRRKSKIRIIASTYRYGNGDDVLSTPARLQPPALRSLSFKTTARDRPTQKYSQAHQGADSSKITGTAECCATPYASSAYSPHHHTLGVSDKRGTKPPAAVTRRRRISHQTPSPSKESGNYWNSRKSRIAL
jgi:hypothetical protein